MIIDDFTSGPYTAKLESGIDEAWQGTGNPDFPGRSTRFWITSLPAGHCGSLNVGGGELSVGTGPDMYHRIEVSYGIGEDGRHSFLNQDLSAFTGLRVNFLFNDLALNFNIVYYSNSGAVYSQTAENISAGFRPFSLDFPFDRFSGKADPSDVDLIVLVAQSGSLGGANDYKLNSFETY